MSCFCGKEKRPTWEEFWYVLDKTCRPMVVELARQCANRKHGDKRRSADEFWRRLYPIRVAKLPGKLNPVVTDGAPKGPEWGTWDDVIKRMEAYAREE